MIERGWRRHGKATKHDILQDDTANKHNFGKANKTGTPTSVYPAHGASGRWRHVASLFPEKYSHALASVAPWWWRICLAGNFVPSDVVFHPREQNWTLGEAPREMKGVEWLREMRRGQKRPVSSVDRAFTLPRQNNTVLCHYLHEPPLCLDKEASNERRFTKHRSILIRQHYRSVK